MAKLIDVEQAIKSLNLEEKVQLLAGSSTWTTQPVDRLNIPSISVSDGPLGVRGHSFFNGPRGVLLPSATAMGATFDESLMFSVGEMLAAEAQEKNCQVLLAPTVCLQRSPLIGRGFESFGEDPWMSGVLASAYINGIQNHGIGVSIKHFVAHDQSTMSPEDSLRMSERTLRELHMLPFQIAVKKSNPWSIMTAYHKVNGVHVGESRWLLEDILRGEWGWDGLVMSDWFGTYSTTESVNAGMDLEMPGPTRWRGELLTWAITAKKVSQAVLNARVRNVLNLVNRVHPDLKCSMPEAFGLGDSVEKRELCRNVAANSIVLLKNDCEVLPLDPGAKKTYALIGPAVRNPAVSGGGSADLVPHYVSTPFDAINDIAGAENIQTAIGAYAHVFTPLLSKDISVPGTNKPGYVLDWYRDDPRKSPSQARLHSTLTTEASMNFGNNIPESVPMAYWLRVTTTFTAPKTGVFQFGLCSIGKSYLYIDGKEKIDLFTQQPEKTIPTPIFGMASMEVTTDLSVEAGQQYEICVVMKNETIVAGVGALNAGGLRIGACEKINPDDALAEAVALATQVDVPIVIAGSNADFESEAIDRVSLDLLPGINKLIESVAKANPNTVIVTQAGCPIAMPWLQHVHTLVHAWFGGQETGNAIADVLFGKTNPAGRLSITFPKRIEDTPAFLSWGKADREIYYGEGVFIGHRYFEKLRNEPLFYFGYGLSYSTFEYSNLKAPKSIKVADAELVPFEISVDVRNSSSRDGHEVVQVYVSDSVSTVLRPVKELKGFLKLCIKAGQTATAKIALDKYAFSFWSEEDKSWKAEYGVFKIIISRSSDPHDEVLHQDVTLENDVFWKGV